MEYTMSLENVMRLVQQMSVEERIEAARMVLGGRVRHLVRHVGNIKFFVHGYEYAQFPDVYELIVGKNHYYAEEWNKVVACAYFGEEDEDVIDSIAVFGKELLDERFEPRRWLTYPRWNNEVW
jgi:hypothetical protein